MPILITYWLLHKFLLEFNMTKVLYLFNVKTTSRLASYLQYQASFTRQVLPIMQINQDSCQRQSP